MTRDQSELLRRLRQARDEAVAEFDRHAIDCPACRSGYGRLQPADNCQRGQRLESNVAVAWSALENAKQHFGATF